MVFTKRRSATGPGPAPGPSLIALLGLLTALGTGLVSPGVARAESVVERAARTGVITMGGRTDLVPYSFINGRKELVGINLDIARLIEAELGRYLNRPVKVEFKEVNDPATLFRQVSQGELDLSCGAQFTWEREMYADFSLPYSLSGIRLLTRTGRLDGSAASLAGRRIGVIPGSQSDATVKALQPAATRVPITNLDGAVADLVAGRLDGVVGDTIVLMGTLQSYASQSGKASALKDFTLVPSEPFSRYAVGCVMPENNSTFRNLVNLAIARLLQGYLDGDAASVATVNQWFGPSGILELPPDLIRSFFRTVLLTVEPLPGARPPASPAAGSLPSTTVPAK